MTTILNPMMADHESKFECLARQGEQIARIVDYDEGERHETRGNNKGFEDIFQNENNILNRENPQIIPRGQNADDNTRSRCYVSLLESEVVKIAVMGLGFYMRRKLLNVHIPDLAHLAERVHQVELMKKEKEKYRKEQKLKSKPFTRKEKVAYVTIESSEEEFNLEAEVSSGFEIVKNSRIEMLIIDEIHNGDIEDLLEISIHINMVGPENTQGNRKPQSDKGKGATPSVDSRIVFPPDGETCPKGILSPAKLEKGKAIAHSPGTDKGKETNLDEEYFEEGDDEMIGTILIIPIEYLGEYEGDPEEDYDMDAEEAFSFIRYEEKPGYFLRPTEKQKSHLRPLKSKTWTSTPPRRIAHDLHTELDNGQVQHQLEEVPREHLCLLHAEVGSFQVQRQHQRYWLNFRTHYTQNLGKSKFSVDSKNAKGSTLPHPC
ncbi:hypothetical protein Ahy_B07g087305 isoform A [Arachis hypogaea]|uniref:Uncharacterized protein n=1 Tax=Arachis hypogaea TaxID=3818 RepID=A0A444YBR3_ARAHY|nr:hypothetical protein Ahy_B07g087305 isoform A [Arachis hypogaea]